MENQKNRPKRLIETIILAVVLLSTALILTDLTTNVVNEINSNLRPTATQEFVPPALPPGMTPAPLLIGG